MKTAIKDFRIAVKAFIVKDQKALLIKRRPNDVHSPGRWDIPGGRLELGENPLEGVKRECKEEVGLDIEIVMPADVQHFVRDDGQRITMIIFLCKPVSEKIALSEEHTGYKWISLDSKTGFPEWVEPIIGNIMKYKLVDVG